MQFRVLGEVAVVDDDGSVTAITANKPRALLALLVLNPNRAMSYPTLAAALWGDAQPEVPYAALQVVVSRLRGRLGPYGDRVQAQSGGYRLVVGPGEADVLVAQDLLREGRDAFAKDDAPRAAVLFERALALWNADALEDLDLPFAGDAARRLRELWLELIEARNDAVLRSGRHLEVLSGIDALVEAEPLREHLRAQQVAALYRAGRQAEALDVYRKTRQALVDELGIDPSKALVELEQQILRQDPGLDLPQAGVAERVVLVVPAGDDGLDGLLVAAEPLARLPDRSLIVARLVSGADELSRASRAVAERKERLAVPARTAVFTSLEPARDIVRLATNYDVELILLEQGSVPDLSALAERTPCDLAVLYGAPALDQGGIAVPFGGAENDWAALELAAWLAISLDRMLTLVGTAADPARGRRDASRLLADASLAVQRVVGVSAEPVLTEPTEDGLIAAVARAGVVVAGFPSRWRAEGLGARQALTDRSVGTVLLVQRGTRPGGLAPRDSWTRFSWSLAG